MMESKNLYLDNGVVKLYQFPLITRIANLFAAFWLSALPFVAFLKKGFSWQVFLFLLICILFDVLIFFSVFKTYLCLDLGRNALILRERNGYKAKIFPLDQIKEIRFSDGVPEEYREFFTIDIVFTNGYVERIKSWSSPAANRIMIFNMYARQKNRLLKFTQECNEILEKNRPTQTTLNP